MTKQEALEIIKGYKQRLDESCSNQLDKDKEAFALAIKALETIDDMVSRRDLKAYFAYLTSVKFKASCTPGDDWAYFSEKEIEWAIDKCPK
jgi:hypothetical protein